MECTNRPQIRIPWNKGKLVGRKAPFKPKEVWAIRARLQMENRARELALFDLGIDSKLRACDLVKLRLCDVCHGSVYLLDHRRDDAHGNMRRTSSEISRVTLFAIRVLADGRC